MHVLVEAMNSIFVVLDLITSALAILFVVFHKPPAEDVQQVNDYGKTMEIESQGRILNIIKKLQTILCACFFIGLLCFLYVKLDSIVLLPYTISMYLFYGSVVFRSFFCSGDHDMSSIEMDAFMIAFILRRQHIQKFATSFHASTESIYSELISLFFLSINWLVVIFSFVVILNLLFNALCKRFAPTAKEIPGKRNDLLLNVGNWMVEKCRHRPLYYFLLPVLFAIDLIKNFVISFPYLLICNIRAYIIYAYNSILVSLCRWQKRRRDTEIIRFDFKLSLVFVLTIIYVVIVCEKNYSPETIDIYSFIATALVLPVLLDGLIGLRKQQ